MCYFGYKFELLTSMYLLVQLYTATYILTVWWNIKICPSKSSHENYVNKYGRIIIWCILCE